LFLRAAAELCPSATGDEAAALVHAGRATASRAARIRDPAVRAVAHAIGDPRFAPLKGGDLRWLFERAMQK
jgi:hypothetical protein